MNDDNTRDGSGSVFIGGSLRDGAISTGAGSSAETTVAAARGDRAPEPDRPGAPLPPPLPTGGPPSGSIVVGGDAEGVSMATGDRSTARSEIAPTDERYQELLEQIRLLRTQLPLLADTTEVSVVETELAEVEAQITDTGAVSSGPLRRLWERLCPGNTALGALASAVTLADMARRLLT